ncbi:MAG TPA: DNA topoisomerase VI subunit B [Candidatus Krumholzibacteria bacterium]|nr:DNA topoisomerase VI subunit B [Candidatus Krumholzibacteria bacterium]
MTRKGSVAIEASPASKKRGSPKKARASAKVAPEIEEDDAPTPRRSRAAAGEYGTAETIAQKQREISVSEFFAKNRHMLGFDSPTRAILTAVKEAVDNSLDACEEAGIAPDILVEIHEISENRYRLVVEDSGPGIVKQQVPKIFGKLLYGSKFHELRQSRGQQGIGISAAVMYAQLTTGKPVKITSRTGAKTRAHLYELQIDTKKNAPIVLDDGPVEWEREHGTRIEMELEAVYQKGKRSVDQYLHQVALANPHADIRFIAPKSDPTHYTRLSDQLPPPSVPIRPHPYGVELGVLIEMMQGSNARNVASFLSNEFSRMSAKTAEEVLTIAKVPTSTKPAKVSRDQAEAIIKAFPLVKIMRPPTDVLSVVGEELLVKSLQREIKADFYTAVSRPPTVYRGNPFQVEVALAYGGPEMKGDELVTLYRFANRAPLIYQQNACAITSAVMSTAWRSYGIEQSKGALPTAPMIILAQIASVWVPFTSESKEAVAHYDDIIKEMKLAVQECGRRLGAYIRRGARERDEAKKRSYIEKYIPHIGIALQEILGISEKEEKEVVDTLVDTLERSRKL